MRHRPPSFVLFLTDQHRADYLGCYGHPVLRTPSIDSLATQGVRFERSYVASPVCMPNRASLLTGRMPSVHGVRQNGMSLGRDNVTFVELLRAAGYETVHIGKAHHQNFSGKPPLLRGTQHASSLISPPSELAQARRLEKQTSDDAQEAPGRWETGAVGWTRDYYGFAQADIVIGHADRAAGDYRSWAAAKGVLLSKMAGPENALPHDVSCPQAWRTAVPEDAYSTSYIAERAIEYLHARAASGADDPFLLVVSFPDPHHPFTPPGRYWDMYKPEDMPPLPAFSSPDWVPSSYVAHLINERSAGRANTGAQACFAVSEKEAREAQALTCGSVAMIDAAIGGILRELERVDRGDVVRIFTSDHGDYLGDHRLLLKGPAAYQGVIRVPLIWSDPSAQQGVTTQSLASTIDLAPSILERAGVAPYEGMQGRSFLPHVRGGAPSRDDVLIEYDHQRALASTGKPPRVHTIVSSRWRLSLWNDLEAGELYDLHEDPNEFRNLWDEPAHAATRLRLMEALARLQMASVDTIPLPTGIA